jgi:hypothetical protein
MRLMMTPLRANHAIVRYGMVMIVWTRYEKEMHEMVRYVSIRHIMATYESGIHVRAVHVRV